MRSHCCCGLGGLAVLVSWLSLLGGGHAQSTFNSVFNSYVSSNNVMPSSDGLQVQLQLDQLSAAAFGSKNTYFFGSYGMRMKLIPNDSAGTVTTFYLSSGGNYHDEFDFECLGNSSGSPYLIHTNIFSNGTGGREQQIYLWFDPTADFHTYHFQWNQDIIIFYVDNTPIRTFKNIQASTGLPYPNQQAMGMYGSVWDGSTWATQGGRVKINWNDAPFIATYRDWTLDGCLVSGSSTVQTCQSSSYATPGANYQTVNQSTAYSLNWVKNNWVHYNYCDDRARYPTKPVECNYNIM